MEQIKINNFMTKDTIFIHINFCYPKFCRCEANSLQISAAAILNLLRIKMAVSLQRVFTNNSCLTVLVFKIEFECVNLRYKLLKFVTRVKLKY